MEIKMMKLHDLVPYENNPRNNEGAIQYVANSIKQFGFKVPIVIDKNNVIVAGHTRWMAADSLNLDEVPVIIADDLTPEQIKAFRIADNKTGEKASWDYTKLSKEIEELTNLDLDINFSDIGFGEFELEALKGIVVDDEELNELEPESPEGFKEYGETVPTKHTCPRCGYEWN